MHRLAASILAIALISCDMLGAKAKPPTGPLGDIARNVAELLAPGTDAKDARFESFLADIDFTKAFGPRAAEISDQIKQARAGATKAKSSRAPAAGRLASVGAVFGESVTIEFAKTLADSLDELTKASATHEYPPLPPRPHVVDGATSVTTSTISQTESVSSVGPQVKLTLNWAYRETTKDKTSGATLVDISEDRTMVGSINICPDGQGAVGAFVDVKDKFTGFANGVTTTLMATSGTVFTGYVGDNAALLNVHETVQDRQSWESASGSGSYEATLSATSNADASGSTSGGLDGNSFQGAFTASDAAAAVRGATAAAWTFVLNGHSLAEAYQSAQRLWRNGRCVMVQAPDYSAETPIAVADQQKPQNDEAVDPSSETKFSTSLKHRFEGAAPSAPLTAVLTSGAKSVAPNRIDGGSGSLTYKAPDEDGKKATVMLQSTSKRGIGTLVLDFHTGGALTLTLTGTATSHLAFIGNTSDQSVQVTIGPIDFKKLTPDIYSATGTWRSTIHSLTANSLGTNTCDGTENGTIDIEAQVETRAGQKVWVITPISMASADGSGTQTCVNSLGGTTLRGVTLPRTVTSDSDGGSATLFLSALDDIVIPSAGGRISVRGTRNVGGTTTISAQGTATATTKK